MTVVVGSPVPILIADDCAALPGTLLVAFDESPEFAQAFNLAQSWGGFLVQVVFGGVMVAMEDGVYSITDTND